MFAVDQPWLHDLVTVLSAPTVVLSEPSGQIRSDGAQGVLHADVRVLSKAVLTIGGSEPPPVSGGFTGARTASFTGAARALGDATADPTVRVERERTVAAGEVSERISVVSFADCDVVTELVLTVAADFATVAEIKAGRPPAAVAPAPVAERPASADGGEVRWGDGSLQVMLSAPDALVTLAGACAVLRWPVRLAGRGVCEVGWRLSVTDPSAVVAAAEPGGWQASVTAGDPRLASLLSQSLDDADALRMTVTAQAQAQDDVFLAAGAPWFFTLFGRDSIWAARLLLPFGWRLAAGTLRVLAAFQGDRVEQESAQTPGKIPHELRRGGSVSYGTIDATPLWVCLLHDAWRWGMPDDQVRALLPNLHAALEYMRSYGDSDGDGLIEYVDTSGRGMSNQGWKDSGDSIRFADGRIASAPVALCEVQGYAYEAAMHGADLLDHFGEPGAPQWRRWAAALAGAFRSSFWADGYPALALDAKKQRVDSLTSNIGHLLGTGLLTAEEEALVAGRLSGADMNSGFGLRTMSTRNGGFNPLSYHCGSVWSHDTAIAIRGLFRSGHATAAASLTDGLLSTAAAFGWRLPELFSGDCGRWPVPYPAACRPQAWSTAAAGALICGVLGLDVDVPAGTVTLRPPAVSTNWAGPQLRVDGLVAGGETFSAGIAGAGEPYVRGSTLTLVTLGGLLRRAVTSPFAVSRWVGLSAIMPPGTGAAATPEPESLARTAYEAHRAVSPDAGPAWEDASDPERRAWLAAVSAITNTGPPTLAEDSLRIPALVIQAGDETHVFKREFTAGRLGTLKITDDHASSHHAAFQFAHGFWFVEDLGSKNGTWLNGRRIYASQRLKKGDKLRIGHTTVQIVSA